ncbi:MAG: hypothetical protein LBG92_12205 [Prevotellaceae bacterium]|jgi:chromosome segregation ATPase|nr:hypothetical protein [Prevotellaceae bacterium]
MKSLKDFFKLAVLAGVLFTAVSCVEDKESQSVSDLRGAKTDQIKAQTELTKAQAELAKAQAAAEAVRAEAEAELQKSQAKINEAQAERVKAEAAYQQALAKQQELENSVREGSKDAEIAAKIAKAEAETAQAASHKAAAEAQLEQSINELEIIKATAAANLEQAKLAAEQQLLYIKQTVLSAKNTLNAEIQSLISNYYYLLSNINQIASDIANVDQEIISTEIRIAQNKIAAVSQRKIDSINIISNYEQGVIDYEKRLAAAEASLAFWKGFDIETAKTALDAVKKELDELKNQRNSAYADYQKAQNTYNVADREYSNYNNDVYYIKIYNDACSYCYNYQYGYQSQSTGQYFDYQYYSNDAAASVNLLNQIKGAINHDILVQNNIATDAQKALDTLNPQFTALTAKISSALTALETTKAARLAAKNKFVPNKGKTADSLAYVRADSIAIDAYHQYFGGIADGNTRVSGYANDYGILGNYNGKTYPSLADQKITLENYIANANNNIENSRYRIQNYNRTLTGVDDLIAKLGNTNKLQELEDARIAADKIRIAKYTEYSDLDSKVNAKQQELYGLDIIANIADFENNNYTSDLYLPISTVETRISYAESDVLYYAVGLENRKSTLEQAKAGLAENTFTILLAQDEAELVRLKARQETLKSEKADKEKQAELVKKSIDEALSE